MDGNSRRLHRDKLFVTVMRAAQTAQPRSLRLALKPPSALCEGEDVNHRRVQTSVVDTALRAEALGAPVSECIAPPGTAGLLLLYYDYI